MLRVKVKLISIHKSRVGVRVRARGRAGSLFQLTRVSK